MKNKFFVLFIILCMLTMGASYHMMRRETYDVGNNSIVDNADTVVNATLTTALTVNTGTLTLTADAGNDSVLTIGGGAVSVSGANTGDVPVSNTAFDMTSWDGVTTIGGSKNAIRDYWYLLSTGYLFLDQNASPDVTGEFLFDNTVAGLTDGAMAYYDGTRIRYVVDLHTLPSTDNYVVTFNSGGQYFEMQPGGSASVAGTDTQVQFNDATAMGADAGLTYNKTTDVLTIVGGVNIGASATPALIMDDSDSASETSDYSLGINSTDTGDGTEDTDIDEEIQIASTLTTIRAVNADGSYTIGTTAMPILSPSLTASEIVGSDANKNIVSLAVATYPSLAELAYVKGLSSAIQTQLDAKSVKVPRVFTAANDLTPDVDADDYDAVTITALEAAITDVNMSGTPVNFQKLIFRIRDDNDAGGYVITWGSDFEDAGVALPIITVADKILTVGFIYNTVSAKWGCVASAQEE